MKRHAPAALSRVRPSLSLRRASQGGISTTAARRFTSEATIIPSDRALRTPKTILPADSIIESFRAQFKIRSDIPAIHKVIHLLLAQPLPDTDEGARRLVLACGGRVPELRHIANMVLQLFREDHADIALRLYDMAGRLGDDAARVSSATLCYSGAPHISQDKVGAEATLRELARKGHPAAQANLATILLRENREIQSVLQLHELAGRGGFGASYAELGRIYKKGLGVPVDEARSFAYFLKAAQKGHPESAFLVGNALFNGTDGQPVDPHRAVQYYQEAAARGLPEAQFNLGQCFFTGKGVPAVDYARAREYWAMSASQGFPIAMLNLGKMYMEGRGLPQDLSRAKSCFEKVLASEGVWREHAQALLSSLARVKEGAQGVPPPPAPPGCTIL